MKKYTYGEAFCLMQYESDDKTEKEVLWNSRDGVTPFCIHSRSGREMRHVNWNQDKCVPDYKPPVGSRMFIDATRELVEPELWKYVDKIWDYKTYPAKERYKTKQECFDALLPDWLGETHVGHAPWIVEVK